LDDAAQRDWEQWTSQIESDVPVKMNRAVWEVFLVTARTTIDPINKPRVFRSLMKRQVPRHVVDAKELEKKTYGEVSAESSGGKMVDTRPEPRRKKRW
jgi:hypothetical protein